MKSISLLIFICCQVSVYASDNSPIVSQSEIESPARPGSGEPRLHEGADGQIYLSWVEQSDSMASFRFAKFSSNEQAFGPAKEIAAGSNWFVNWADTPGLCALSNGTLAAHWLVKTGARTFDYEIRYRTSTDGGDSWGEPQRLHDDSDKGEHGFVSAAALDDRFAFIWLKVTPTETDSQSTTLRYREVMPNGERQSEITLDDRACTCCGTSLIQASSGQLWAVYRDRTSKEIRDISFVSRSESTWTKPKPVFDDRWTMPGCPVNGPVLATRQSKLAVTWYTGAGNDGGRVNLAYRNEENFGYPIRIDDGRPEGRPDLTITEAGATLVVWLEYGDQGAEWRLRRISPEEPTKGQAGQAIASVPQSRSSGFAQIASSGKDVIFAWTDPGSLARVRTSILKLRQ